MQKPTSLFSTLVSTMFVVVGLGGSLYAEEIRSSLMTPYLWWTETGTVSWAATIFWTLFILTSGSFFLLRKIENKEANERVDRQLEATTRIEELVRTQPPRHVLEQASDYLEMAMLSAQKIRQTPDNATREAHLREILAMILLITQRFGTDDESARYGVNVMEFVNPDDSRWTDELVSRIRFLVDEADPKLLRGVLDLHLALSVSSDSLENSGTTDEEEAREEEDAGQFVPDTRLAPLALPIPIRCEWADNKGEKKWRLLPGAPFAFCTEKVSNFDDTDDLLRWCEENSLGEIVTDVEEYFAEGRGTYRSFISIPLFRDREVFAVLNIHRDRRCILTEEHILHGYFSILRPFLKLISDSLDVILEQKTRIVLQDEYSVNEQRGSHEESG